MAQKVEYELSLKDLLTGKLREADSAAKGLENTVKNIATTIGAAFAISKIKDFAMSIVDVGSKVENATTGLTTLLGNSAAATKVVNDTMADAMATPFAFESLLSANKALISAGVSAQGARQDVLNLSNAIAATGGGDDELQRMVVNLQQIKNVGQASALDIKQFAYAGVNIYKVLEAAGIKVEKGNSDVKISYEQITGALQKAHEAGGIYYNGLENMAGNTSVKVSNLGDMMFQLKNQMFQDLKPAITSIIEGLGNLIRWLRDAWDWLVKHKDIIKSLAIGIGVGTAALILYRTWVILTTSSTALGTIAQIALGRAYDVTTKSTGLVTAAQVGFNAVLKANPIGSVITLVMGLVTAIDYLYEKYEKFRNFADGLIDGVRGDIGSMTGNMAMMFMDRETPEASFEQRRAAEGVIPGMRSMFDDPTKDLDSFSMKLGNVKKKASSIINTGQHEGRKKDVSAKGAVGNRSVTINIKMDNLVKEFKVITTNIKESPEKILELLKPAFASVINDGQIIGNR